MKPNAHTEEEAGRMFCCLPGVDAANCIGSQCMAWRWQPLSTDDDDFLGVIKKYMKDNNVSHQKAVAYVHANREEFKLRSEPYQGFCGLAGSSKV